jgi:hypothetical protein
MKGKQASFWHFNRRNTPTQDLKSKKKRIAQTKKNPETKTKDHDTLKRQPSQTILKITAQSHQRPTRTSTKLAFCPQWTSSFKKKTTSGSSQVSKNVRTKQSFHCERFEDESLQTSRPH